MFPRIPSHTVINRQNATPYGQIKYSEAVQNKVLNKNKPKINRPMAEIQSDENIMNIREVTMELREINHLINLGQFLIFCIK